MSNRAEELYLTIKKVISNDLPGQRAQLKLAPMARDITVPKGHTPREAVVGLLVVLETAEIIFIRRSFHPKDKHSGQISFPGGKIETTDASNEAAVLREIEEEIGVSPSDIELLGSLSPLFISVSNFLVFPFVGVLKTQVPFSKQDEEVDEVLLIKLQDFLDAEVVPAAPVTIASATKKAVAPAYVIGSNTIWGATAMMLSEFLTALRLIK